MDRHAYLILAHKNWDQLGTLIRLLDDVRNDIYIHVDLKSSLGESDQKQLRAVACLSAVSFVERGRITWGDYSIVDAELRLLKAAIVGRHRYYHLLSGMDLPLKRQDEIHNFFLENAGWEFVHFNSPDWTQQNAGRIRRYWPLQGVAGRPGSRLLTSLAQKAVSGLQRIVGVDRARGFDIASGSQWFSVTEAFARYLCQREAEIRKHFRFTFCPDEWFVQTMLANSEFARRVWQPQSHDTAKCSLRYIDWTRGDGASPYTLRMEDYQTLIESGCLFARKFDEAVDSAIIDQISEIGH